ncbi:NitT/TauT family transport system substrate-binding protein [Actimicrobium sp. GrIS 1.19]|uniref:ABC transporter substrate-binding protein n=1 Tax=Actimicrobium sp. GrIS 1.19 TaxID=3071708 RepID=UPI002DFF07B9|nr:NitT/TauT family transport system substrate-binding protein [Actimicrobium sp. GrIS 1.19]
MRFTLGYRAASFKARVALLVVLLALCLLGWFVLRPPAAQPLVLAPVRMAIPLRIISAPMFVGMEQGAFRNAGVNIIAQPFEMARDALKSLMDGKSDLTLIADTRLMFALLDGADIAVLANVAQSRRSLGIVTRIDRGINRLADLQGKKIGLTLGTNLPYFLDALLQINSVGNDRVNWVDLDPDALHQAFKAGRIDAAAMFQPYLARLEQEMDGRVKVFFGEEVYAFRLVLVGRPGYIDSHPEEVRRVLKGLLTATDSIHADPVAARRVVGKMFKMDDALMARIFDPEDYVVSLDQALLLALDDQSRWAMKERLAPARAMPNFLNVTRYQFLETVKPGAVTLVH